MKRNLRLLTLATFGLLTATVAFSAHNLSNTLIVKSTVSSYSLTLTDSNHLAGVETVSSSTYVTYNRSNHPIEMEYYNAKSSNAGHINLVNGVLRNNTEISGISGITVNFTGTLKLLLSTDKETWPVSYELTSGVDPMSLSLDTFNYFLLRGDADISSINISYTCGDETYELDANLIVNHLDSVGYPILASTVNKGALHTDFEFATPTIDGLIANHPTIEGVYREDLLVRNVYYNKFDTYTTSSVASTDFVEEDGFYYIDNIGDFLAFAQSISASTGKLTYKGKTIVLRTSIDWNNEAWTTIGHSQTGIANRTCSFSGTLLGNNNIIANLSINSTTSYCNGLFSYIEGSTIRDLSTSGTFKVRDRTGGIAYAACGNDVLDNIHVYTDINTTHTSNTFGFSGGILGSALASTSSTVTFTNCGYYGKYSTSGADDAGGIIGQASKGNIYNITNCTVHLDEESNVNGNSGGFVGQLNGTVNFRDCLSSGALTTSSNTVGGFAGYINVGVANFYDCVNYLDITTANAECIGGFTGYNASNSTIKIHDSINYGNMSGKNRVAGISGYGAKVEFDNCLNMGDITSTTGVAAGINGSHQDSAKIYGGGGNLGNIRATASGGTAGGLTGYNGINSTIDFDNLNVGGTVSTVDGVKDMVATHSNNIIIHKYVNGVVVDYDFLIPGNAYTPTTHRYNELELVEKWYTDPGLTMEYVDGTILGTTGVNSNNTRLYLYAEVEAQPASQYGSGLFYNNLEVDFPTLQNFGLINPEFQSVDPTLYNFQMWTTNEGIMIYNEQNVKNFVTEDGNNWKNTHCEFEIWNNDFGYGWGGTYLALFTDGTYYLNNETNLKGFYYYVEYEQIEDITHIEYYTIIEFDNNTTNDAESYAYIKPYQFMPEEYHEGLNSINHWRDDRWLITGTEKSFQVHETIDAFMLT